MAEAASRRIAVSAGSVQESILQFKGVNRNLVFMALVMTFVFIACSFFYVWWHHQVIALGYEISNAGKEEQELIQQNKKLRLELAGLRSPSRIESIALKELKFTNPKKEQLIIVR